VCLVAATALGNGRFPRAQRLVESEKDPNLLALYGTYGLIVSSDAGADWNHVCEAATGTYTGEDPLLELLPDGKILARTEVALVKSEDSWCNWGTVRDGVANQVQDITRGPSSPMTVLALVGVNDLNTGYTSMFTQSTDGGSTWSTEAKLPLITRALTLDVAPSNPQRVVISGLDASRAGRLLVSDNGGQNWLGKAIPGTDSVSAPYLAAISKNDPNRIFVRTDGYKDINGIDTAADALLITLDGGATWATAIEKNAKLFGFALSPDESTLLVGYGDPVVAATYVEPLDLGIYRADTAAVLADPANAAALFEKIFDASVTCLRWTTSGLFACTSQDERGFEVGKAPNAAFTLADTNPFTSLLSLPKVRPLPCSAGTDGYACYSDPTNGFASVCGVFKASCDASAPPPSVGGGGGSPDASVGPSSGGATNPSSGGSGGGGGVAGSGAGGATPMGGGGPGPAGSAGGPAPSGEPASSSSCGCRAVGAESRTSVGALLVAIAALVRRRRQGV
jgi:photosystem II stability/assembly factor-like uncharacterized protein